MVATYRKSDRKNGDNSTPVLIVNPNSCSGLTGTNWDRLYDQIKVALRKSKVDVLFTKKTGDGTEFARNCLRRGYSEIYAIGGDGTINEIANGFFEITEGIHNN